MIAGADIQAAPTLVADAPVLVHAPQFGIRFGTILTMFHAPEGHLYGVVVAGAVVIVHHRWVCGTAGLPDRALCHYPAVGGSA
ncbi:hypothetical protein [Falsiroseomonas sp.]|uniref:hypothetical protein n=1 Tax=Falsiroseomonas sp. TaxID=2870721 RepID=UPI003F71D782